MSVRVLVTGNEGQLARSLGGARRTSSNVEIIGVGRPELDLERPETIERMVSELAPHIVISAAGYTAVDRAESEPEIAVRINGEAPGILARAARAAGTRIVHISTDYVYDGAKAEPYVETDPVNPQSVYGAASARARSGCAKNTQSTSSYAQLGSIAHSDATL